MKKVMKFVVATISTAVLLSPSAYAGKIEQTICFSKAKDEIKIKVYGKRNPALKRMSICDLSSRMTVGSVGDGAVMCGGRCQGKTLPQMNNYGWRLIHVVEGLNGAFGMVFER